MAANIVLNIVQRDGPITRNALIIEAHVVAPELTPPQIDGAVGLLIRQHSIVQTEVAPHRLQSEFRTAPTRNHAPYRYLWLFSSLAAGVSLSLLWKCRNMNKKQMMAM